MKEKSKKIISMAIIIFMILNYFIPVLNYAEENEKSNNLIEGADICKVITTVTPELTTVNNEITVTISVSDITEKIGALSMTINYDPNEFEMITNINNLNEWTSDLVDNFLILYAPKFEGTLNNGQIASIKFKVKSNCTEGKKKISFNNVEVSKENFDTVFINNINEMNVTIDKTAPIINVEYSPKVLTNQNITAIITSNEQLKGISGWTLSTDKMTLTKEYTQNKQEEITVKDLAGNEVKQTIKIENIDKVKPELKVNYSPEELTNKNVAVTITSNKELQGISGWTLSEDKMTLTKEYSQNKQEEITVKDLAGNEVKQTIKIANIDKVKPELKVNYSPKELTNKNVTATITSNEELQGISGWTLSTDKMTLTKEYSQNKQEEITVKDLAGNEVKQTIKIANIDKVKPELKVNYSPKELTNKNVTATITSNKELQGISGWTLSTDKMTLTKEYSQNKQEEITVKDLAGNEVKQTIKIANIDKVKPELKVNYSPKELTNKNVIATITSNEELQEISGWTLSTDKMTLTKEYTQNKEEEVTVKDLAGNEAKISIKINNIEKNIVENMKGDLNENKKIDIGDILILKRYIAYSNSKETANKYPKWNLNAEKILVGDLNGNGKIDVGDILKLQRYIAASTSKETAEKHSGWLNL